MSLTYFKRYRMEADLRRLRCEFPKLPEGYRLLPWSVDLIPEHAEAKYLSFRNEIDSTLFGCLGELQGCEELMQEIADRDGFLPEATWLVEYSASPSKTEVCGTIQGVRATSRLGSIQNVGVTPYHRSRGIATGLMQVSLLGFQQAGVSTVYLEVTAQNRVAVQLYERLGFKRVKTLYKAIELAYS